MKVKVDVPTVRIVGKSMQQTSAEAFGIPLQQLIPSTELRS